MSFLNSMDISASGLTAQRKRLDIIAENVANVDTTRTEKGGAYRRKLVVFEDNAGNYTFREHFRRATNLRNDVFQRADLGSHKKVRGTYKPGVKVKEIIEDQSELKLEYNPEHPDADEYGYVERPNVNMLEETIDSMSATRSYQANLTVLNAIKLMSQKAIEIGK